MSSGNEPPPFLKHVEAYLSRRDGVDKLLKVTRYTCKLLLASPALRPKDPALSARLQAFEASVGTSRKAFRLGKFVQDLNALLAAPSLCSVEGLLECISSGGEGVYYFVEQFVWLAKAGLLDKHHQQKLQVVSAWAEFTGYFGSVTLKSLQVQAMLAKESELVRTLEENKGSAALASAVRALRLLDELRSKRFLKMLSIVQDLADALLALNDIKEVKGVLANPALLSFCGLLSALISMHKNWTAC